MAKWKAKARMSNAAFPVRLRMRLRHMPPAPCQVRGHPCTKPLRYAVLPPPMAPVTLGSSCRDIRLPNRFGTYRHDCCARTATRLWPAPGQSGRRRRSLTSSGPCLLRESQQREGRSCSGTAACLGNIARCWVLSRSMSRQRQALARDCRGSLLSASARRFAIAYGPEGCPASGGEGVE